MKTEIEYSQKDTSSNTVRLFRETAASARYLVDANGIQTDVVLPLPVWEKLLQWLEDQEDRAVALAWLPRLQAGPEAAGALAWEDVADTWDDGAELSPPG